MKVKIMGSRAELESTQPFVIEHLLWDTKAIPKSYVYLGFVPKEGFYLKMVCEERAPLRTHKKNGDPVYQDSAMEAFLKFEPETRDRDATYLNLEMNANGALLGGYGSKRIYRSYFTEEECKMLECQAKIKEDRWEASLFLPITILEKIYGPLHLGEGSTFTCNFYKISETKEIEHYAAYAPIHTKTPDFHLPEYFETACLSANIK